MLREDWSALLIRTFRRLFHKMVCRNGNLLLCVRKCKLLASRCAAKIIVVRKDGVIVEISTHTRKVLKIFWVFL